MKKVLVVCPNPSIDIYAHLSGFAMGVPNRIQQEERYPGGKGLHVAMALAELGIPVTVAGFWGGEAGTWIKKACNRYYPKVQFIGPELEDWSRSCYTFKAEGDFDDTEILGPGPIISSSNLDELMTSITHELKDTAMLALCGSWPKGSPENGYEMIIRLGKTHEIPSFLDSTGIQLENGLKAHPFGIHLNRKEITEYYGLGFEQAKVAILDACEIAAITDGAKGLHLMTNSGSYHALAHIEEVISTIGSGDCLTAGIIAGLMQNKEGKQLAALGAACGAANCLRKDLGMLYAQDVQKLTLRAEVNPL